MHTFREFGNFWLPNAPTKTVAGVVEFDKSTGCRLEIVGSFSDDPSVALDPDQLAEIPIILGRISNKGEVTLYDCYSKSMKLGSEVVYREYIVSMVIDGGLFERKEDLNFSKYRLQFTYIENWLARSGLSAREIREDARLTGFTTAYRYPELPNLSIEAIDCCIRFSPSFTLSRSFFRKQSLSEDVTIVFEFAIPVNIADFARNVLSAVSTFFIISLDRLISIKNFVAVYVPASEQPSTNSGKELYISYQPRSAEFSDDGSEDLFGHDMLISYDDIAEIFNTVLSRWFDSYSNFEKVFSLYTEYFYESGVSYRKFLDTTRTFESLHRRLFTRPENEISQISLQVERVTNAASTADRTWLKDRLKFAHEPSLRNRLKQAFRSRMGCLGLDKRAVLRIVSYVVNTRNDETHGNTSTHDSDASFELHWNTEIMKWLNASLICLVLGLPDEVVKQSFTRNQSFLNTRAHIRSLYSRTV